jgi:Eco57I restriction endonuclease.
MTTQSTFTLRGRNPDVLTCIANLSNDEVFTPPEFANRMLDTLAEAWAAHHSGANLWADQTVKFLDPCTKSGVFLREITSRLTKGLEKEIPDLQKRVDHILTKQVFGIGITKITSLLARRSVYCSKHAQGEHSIGKSFASDDGNIWFQRTEHTWVDDRCKFCRASKNTFERGEGLETHAYAFIHSENINTRIDEIFRGNMQFDVIIGNPPYQLASDGGTRDVPIYQDFVEQAKKLQPRFLSMVIPSRWMASGLGLTEFRRTMLNDRSIRALVDYERMSDVFPGVDFEGGICYFLWDRDYNGDCQVISFCGDEQNGPTPRDLREHDVFVRDSRALEILKKVLATKEKSITEILSVDKEFGWTSNFEGFHEKRQAGDVAIVYHRKGKRLTAWIERKAVHKSAHLIDKWKVMVPQAFGERGARPAKVLGGSFIVSSPSVCTQTYLFFSVDSEKQSESLNSYISTRFFRFLVSLRKITQHATRSTYTWVPKQSWDRLWTDKELFAKYGITRKEQEFIESQVRPMNLGDKDDE